MCYCFLNLYTIGRIKAPNRIRRELLGYRPSKGTFWKTSTRGFEKLLKADRIQDVKTTLAYVRYAEDFAVVRFTNWWDDTKESTFATLR